MIVNIRLQGPAIQNPSAAKDVGWYYIGMASDEQGYMLPFNDINLEMIEQSSVIIIDWYEHSIEGIHTVRSIVQKCRNITTTVPILITLEAELLAIKLFRGGALEQLRLICSDFDSKVLLCDKRVEKIAEQIFNHNIIFLRNHYVYNIEATSGMSFKKRNIILLPRPYSVPERDGFWGLHTAYTIALQQSEQYQIVMLRCHEEDLLYCDELGFDNVICLPEIDHLSFLRICGQAKLIIDFDGLYATLGRSAVEAAIGKTIYLHSGTGSISSHLYPDSICSPITADVGSEILNKDNSELLNYAHHEVQKYSFKGINEELKEQLSLEYL